MTTEVMVVKKNGPGHRLESTMARITVKMKTMVMMHRLQTIRRAREPLGAGGGRSEGPRRWLGVTGQDSGAAVAGQDECDTVQNVV